MLSMNYAYLFQRNALMYVSLHDVVTDDGACFLNACLEWALLNRGSWIFFACNGFVFFVRFNSQETVD